MKKKHIEIICGVVGHKWRSGSAGSMTSAFGAMVVNFKHCQRCGISEHHFSTAHDFAALAAIDPTEQAQDDKRG